MKFFAIILSFLLINYSVAHTQSGTIEGSISDASTLTPIIGASINVGKNIGDNSDLMGRFNIPSVNPGFYELIVSHVGYKTEFIPVEVKPNYKAAVEIQLKKSNLDLAEVKLNSKKRTGINTISAVDIRLRPINTSQDILRIVPGLFIAQHAGGGKAEQIFLRGFDIDHGTDIAITVDGIPVNMVSHAHGQGYADLHFLIPETVEKVAFDKGPYFADQGNLATAAYIDFSTKDFIHENLIKTEFGQFNTQRYTSLLKIFNKRSEKILQQFYIASEYLTSDGYFESPQNFHRFNLMGKYNIWFGEKSQLTITASTFDSRWNASGQIPERAVLNNYITRFGSIDNTEGGSTGRTNFNINFNTQLKNNWKSVNQLFYSHYKFNLFSNFTFFLNDSINGDMIQQRESRDIYGFKSQLIRSGLIGNSNSTTTIGTGFRYDNIKDIELSKANRITHFYNKQKGTINELNSFLFINQDFEISDKLNINAGIRYDHFTFLYQDLNAHLSKSLKSSKDIISPKLNISYDLNSNIKIYLNNGFGFHSNDTRVILQNEIDKSLPKVFGTDLGVELKPLNSLIIKTAVWHLFSEQEFVYVGDEGIVEANGRSRRIGVDLSARYQFTKWLYGDFDLNWATARSIDNLKGENFIPLAPEFTSIGGVTARLKNGFSSSFRYRYMADRPADEFNLIKAKGYLLADIFVSFRIKKFEISISGENLFNNSWNEAQFNTTTKIKNESTPITEIHFTPGTPRNIKAGISFHF